MHGTTRKSKAAMVAVPLALLASGCGGGSSGGATGGATSAAASAGYGAASAASAAASAGSGAASAATGSTTGGGGDKLAGAKLTVGSKEFTESKVLAQITIGALDNAGADVKAASLSGSATVRKALESKEIDMYWEYTGTGWVNILKNSSEKVPDQLYEAVAKADKANKIAWLPQAPMNDTYRIAVKKQFAEENNLKTMSDAATFVKSNPDKGAVCAASEFLNRDDGLPGLQKAYAFKFAKVAELDLGLVYTQVGKTCDFGEVFSTDGRILANELVSLEDDKKFFVDYNAALTMRQETLDQYPAIAEVMAPISAKLTNEEITKLNAAVDVDGDKEEDVAKDWLKENGFSG